MTTNYLLTEEQYKSLPALLYKTCGVVNNNNERDILLLGTLTVLSACLPKIKGRYDGGTTNTNLFSLIVARAGSGKGIMKYCKTLVKGYDDRKKTQGMIDQKSLSLFLAGNSSSASLVESIEANNGEGIIFETEADSLSVALDQEWGNFSDLLRKGFHGESYQVGRQNGSHEIEDPRFAILLSGTHDQLRPIISSIANGLFSRFLYYTYTTAPIFRDVFRDAETTYDDAFRKLSDTYLALIDHNEKYPFILNISTIQAQVYKQHFQVLLDKIKDESPHLAASINRLALSIYRILIILTAIRRHQENDMSDRITCSEVDFHLGLVLSNAFFNNILQVVPTLYVRKPGLAGRELLYSKLPECIFTTEEAENICIELGNSKKTASNYLARLCEEGRLEKPSAGKWKKI